MLQLVSLCTNEHAILQTDLAALSTPLLLMHVPRLLRHDVAAQFAEPFRPVEYLITNAPRQPHCRGSSKRYTVSPDAYAAFLLLNIRSTLIRSWVCPPKPSCLQLPVSCFGTARLIFVRVRHELFKLNWIIVRVLHRKEKLPRVSQALLFGRSFLVASIRREASAKCCAGARGCFRDISPRERTARLSQVGASNHQVLKHHRIAGKIETVVHPP